jgi:hypothetical protein
MDLTEVRKKEIEENREAHKRYHIHRLREQKAVEKMKTETEKDRTNRHEKEEISRWSKVFYIFDLLLLCLNNNF